MPSPPQQQQHKLLTNPNDDEPDVTDPDSCGPTFYLDLAACRVVAPARASARSRPSGATALVVTLPLVDEFGLERGHPGFEGEDATYADEGQPLVDEGAHLDDLIDLVAAVAALASFRPRGTHDIVLVEAAQEGLLDAQHVRHLPDREDGRVAVVDRELHNAHLRQLTERVG